MAISWKRIIGCFPPLILIVRGCVCFAAPGNGAPAGVDEPKVRYTLDAGLATARDYAESLRILTGYPADPGECGDVMLGPLPRGEYTGEEAWLKLIAPVCALMELPEGLSGRTRLVADMSDCKCSFGFSRYARLQPLHVLVERPSLSQLGEIIPSQVVVLDRERIEETGAASVPDLLRYLSQTAFHRGRGFRASGAQYAELRGLGAGYTLVLLNGRRTFGSATDLVTNAFDLSYIPISAVKRVEISMDANSLVHGMDAVGGIVNVVLKNITPPAVNVRYDSVGGGGSQSQASISGSARGERGRLAVYFDAEHSSELMGRERDRWNNQNFVRFGGLDYRAPFGSRANVRSMDGQDLPDLESPIAAAEVDPITGRLEFVGGRQDRTSLRAFQAIVPEGSRASLMANGALVMGASVASLELLAVQRDNELQLMPSFVAGATWGADHPENPFGMPVKLDAVLGGLPSQRQHYKTTSLRGVAAIDGPWGDWDYSAFVSHSDERTRAQLRNVTNSAAVAQALEAVDGSEPLSLYRPVWPLPARLAVNTPVERYYASATYLNASLQGSLFGANTQLGLEHRQERLDFDTRLRGARRDITSTFAHVRVPLVNLMSRVAGLESLSLVMGARLDHYGDIGTVTKTQLGAIWQPAEALRVHVSSSESFRPPSLVELYFPRTSGPATFFDARRNELAPMELITGGNPDLQPTTGHSSSLGITFRPRDQWLFSAEYWRIKVRDHVSLLGPMALLAHEDEAIDGRIKRASQSPEEEASGRRGRLVRLDISRANVGGAATQGVDVSAEVRLQSGNGMWKPRLLFTFTDQFAYSDLPITQLRMEDRADVASELGSIPAQRAVASLAYERNAWQGSVHARVVSSYHDINALTGEPMQRRVAGGAVWDLNVSRKVLGELRVTFGAFNVTDREPPYAHAGGSLGFDSSQYDLQGRVLYGMFSGEF